MIKFILFTITLLTSLISSVSAVPNVTAIRVGKGNCAAYPNSYPSAGDNADAFVFRPDQADNSTINGLSTAFTGTSLVVYENTNATSAVFCCDRGGIILDPFGVQSLLISTNQSDEELGYLGQGIQPEGYAHEINGLRQDGRFLGWANVTTWAFKKVAHADYYQVRLLLGNGDSMGKQLHDGEFMGFLKILPPPAS